MEKERVNQNQIEQLSPEEQEKLEKEKKAIKLKKAAKIMAVTGLVLMLAGILCKMYISDEPHGVIRQETQKAEVDVAEDGHENWENAAMPVFMPEEMDTVVAANPNQEHYLLQYRFYDTASGEEIMHTGLIGHGDVEYINLAVEMGLKSGEEAEVKSVTYVIYDDDNTVSPQTLEQTFSLYKI